MFRKIDQVSARSWTTAALPPSQRTEAPLRRESGSTSSLQPRVVKAPEVVHPHNPDGIASFSLGLNASANYPETPTRQSNQVPGFHSSLSTFGLQARAHTCFAGQESQIALNHKWHFTCSKPLGQSVPLTCCTWRYFNCGRNGLEHACELFRPCLYLTIRVRLSPCGAPATIRNRR